MTQEEISDIMWNSLSEWRREQLIDERRPQQSTPNKRRPVIQSKLEPICPECQKPCRIIPFDDSFDYAGTHCTGGQPGTHHLPIWYGTDCCEALLEDYVPEDNGPDYD